MANEDDVLIPGFGIRGYRSFGGDHQFFGPLKKVNLFVGTNNSGKSNVLRFVSTHLHAAIDAATGNSKVSFDELDRPRNSSREGVEISFAWPTDDVMENRLPDGVADSHNRRATAEKLLNASPASLGASLHWFKFECHTGGGPLELSEEFVEQMRTESGLADSDWQNLWRGLTGRQGGGIKHWTLETLNKLNPARRIEALTANIVFIPAIRELEKQGEEATVEGGKNIIERLARLERPDFGERSLRQQFDKIQEFVREVTGQRDAEIEVLYGRDTILVRMQGRELPLRSLGTGIQEVVLMAATATATEESIVCIEEPEVHLHPTLQRKLLRYLRERTNNQYFIATHSAHVLDIDQAAIFHLRLEDGFTVVDAAVTDRERFKAAHDLGYRASDLLQANCIVWVEGPSDRIYLNHWIQALNSDLMEGLHYSIMFYGGRLLSHLSASDERIDEFIELQRLNRHIALVMDSDRDRKEDRRNHTKVRVEHEIEDADGFVWTTMGREIENYVTPEVMLSALRVVDPKAKELVASDRFDKAYEYTRGAKVTHQPPNKVRLANAVAGLAPDLDRLDLHERASALVDFIQSANIDI